LIRLRCALNAGSFFLLHIFLKIFSAGALDPLYTSQVNAAEDNNGPSVSDAFNLTEIDFGPFEFEALQYQDAGKELENQPEWFMAENRERH
jgi:hypothetical protein